MSVRVKLTMSPTQEILFLKRGLNKGGKVQRFLPMKCGA